MNSDLSVLQGMFKMMNDTGFDTDKPLKWGFYFYDVDQNKLLKIYDKLKDHGFTNEGIDQIDNNHRLLLGMIDTLTPEKLHRINLSFNNLAETFGVSLYDGWDVEKVK